MKLPGFDRLKSSKRPAIPHAQYVALIDIGVGSVKTGVGKFNQGKVEVTGVSEASFSSGLRSRQRIIDRGKLVDEIDNALAEAAMQADMRPQHALFSLGGELVRGVTTIVRLKRELPEETIDRKELKHIIKRVQESAFSEAQERLKNDYGDHVNWELVNVAFPIIRLDNVLQKDLVGRTGKLIEVEVFNAFADAEQLNLFSMIADELALDVLTVTTSAYAMVQSLVESIHDSSKSGILIDVGGQMSEVSIFHNGGMVGSHTFSLGGDMVTESLASLFNVDWAESEKMKVQYVTGELDVARVNKLREVARQMASAWVVGVESALELFEHVDYYPPTFYLAGGGANLPEYRAALSAHTWVEKLAFEDHPNVVELSQFSQSNVLDQTGRLNSPELLGVAALANLAVGLEQGDVELQGVLEDVVESL